MTNKSKETERSLLFLSIIHPLHIFHKVICHRTKYNIKYKKYLFVFEFPFTYVYDADIIKSKIFVWLI